MKKLVIQLDDEIAEVLAARIDDFAPTLKDVAKRVLVHTGTSWALPIDRKLCDCQALAMACDDPAVPVTFDRTTEEYQIIWSTASGSGQMIVRFCPFCGGRAPPSMRDRLFFKIPPEEKQRLAGLTAGIGTINDAAIRFGEPDEDKPDGVMTQSFEGWERDEWALHRVVTYKNLSGVADIRFTEMPGGKVAISFQGKYIPNN